MKTNNPYPGVLLAGLVAVLLLLLPLLLGPGLNLAAQTAEAAATTTSIPPGATGGGPATVEKGDTLVVEKGATVDLSLTNRGTLINRGTVTGTINNEDSGRVVNEEGGTIAVLMENKGTFENFGNFASPQKGTFENHGTVINHGYFDSHTMNVVNTGTFDNLQGATFFIFNGVGFDNSGTVHNAGRFELSKATHLDNKRTVDISRGGELIVGGYGTGSGSKFTNDATVNNSGIITNHDYFFNNGTFDNAGVLNINSVGFIVATFSNSGTLANECGATIDNQGTFTGNQPVNKCAYPVKHMADTTASAGYGVYVFKPARAEYVSQTSQLVGDRIDSITLKLKKVGAIGGTAEIGVFNGDLSVRKLFGTLDVTKLTTAYADYKFTLANGELYTIQAGDRVGIKYTGGSATSWVSVMLDLDPSEPFDGANSYLNYYQAGAWQHSPSRDMYMTLEQTHG
ncbi:MAG: hypothetical protein ABI347_09470 [Nitrososphaera sp.]|jgi:hypothetical protein